MTALVQWYSNLTVSRFVQVFVASVLPLVENKGAIVLAASLKLKWYIAFLTSTLGAYLPVPFLLRAKTQHLRRRLSRLSQFRWRSLTDSLRRCRRALGRYGHWGIFFVVSIPFTGVGCWLSAILANLSGVNRRWAAAAIFLGTLVSGLITTAMVYGLVSGIAWLIQ